MDRSLENNEDYLFNARASFLLLKDKMGFNSCIGLTFVERYLAAVTEVLVDGFWCLVFKLLVF